MPDACVFCLIASREREVSAVRETARVLAIMDIDLRHARARGGRTHRWQGQREAAVIFGRRRRSAATGPEQESRTTYGAIEDLRVTLDLDALRATRDAHGPIVAIRQLRTEHPALGLAEANEIIQGL